jgi:hypothetical protein
MANKKYIVPQETIKKEEIKIAEHGKRDNF